MTAVADGLTIDERLDRLSAQVEEIAADLRGRREARDQWHELAQTLACSLPEIEALVAQMRSVTDLGAEVASISGAGVAKLSEVLADADRKGYFVVARGGATVVDRVVTSLADEDFEALGERAERTLTAVRASLSTTGPAPSTFGLLKRFRDPQTRRGMARALDLLRALGADPSDDRATDDRATDDPSNQQKG